MSRHFDVVGEDEYGEPQYAEFDEYGNQVGDVMGAAPQLRRAPPRALARPMGQPQRRMVIPPRPEWRKQLAPGVIQPDEGLVPLPLQPLQNGGSFAAAVPQITFQGQLQKPYRAERLLVSVVRTGASATGRLLGLLWVGTDLQQGDIFGFDIEVFGAATAFGTRLTCKAAQPGVLIRLVVNASTVPTGTDTIFASVQFAGRVVH